METVYIHWMFSVVYLLRLSQLYYSMYCIYTSQCIYSSQLHILTWFLQSDCVKLWKKKKPVDVDFGHRLQRRGQTAVQLRAAGHSPVCFLSTVEFIWAQSYKHMNGPQCVHSVLTSLHQCGWDTPCPGKCFRKTLCRLRRMKQSWFEAMQDLPGCATGLGTVTQPSPCWSSRDQFRTDSLCPRKNRFIPEYCLCDNSSCSFFLLYTD